MDRVPDFESVGCAFESRRGRFLFQWFESHSPEEGYARGAMYLRFELITPEGCCARPYKGHLTKTGEICKHFTMGYARPLSSVIAGEAFAKRSARRHSLPAYNTFTVGCAYSPFRQ